MGGAVAHQISPELVLVCPELREHALTLLPAFDPDELFAVEPRVPIVEQPRLVLVEPVPEPRARLPVALAAYFTEAIFLGAVRGTAVAAVIVVLAFALSW